ncbi:hypothetical protein [Streptomyces sp. NBC_01618]|uniref:hypothetical protein n=1 Tax=Streptomyces sp. NBC_01618 TaxID=2975900 RepID=UPI003865FE42
MNTRGLTELVILGVGLQLGLLDPSLYSLMVVMALVTTAMTGPLLLLIGTRTTPSPTSAVPDEGALEESAVDECVGSAGQGRRAVG